MPMPPAPVAEMAEMFPAVAVGGPAVNAFTAQIYEDLPVAFTRAESTTKSAENAALLPR